MITIFSDKCNPVSQVLYNNVLCDLQFHQLTCTCGHSACLTIHGYYKRHIKHGDSLMPLRICRVCCSMCRKTHALLPSSIVPYSRVALSEQIKIISCHESHEDFSSVMNEHPSIDESNIRYIIHQYLCHWLQRLLSAALSFSPQGRLIHGCFSSYNRQFMQIKRTPNILFLDTT